MRPLALLLSLALGWALNAQPAPIRIVIGELDGINPLILGFEDQLPPVDLVFDRLVSMDPKGNFLPEILEGWELSPDQREATLKVRPGLIWQDGHPLDADDILFTWNLVRSPRMVAISDNQGRWIPSMTKVGPLTLRVKGEHPMPSLEALLYNFIPVPKHLYPPVGDPAKHPFTWAPVGSGPYRVKPGANRKDVQLVRWEGYRGPHPGLAPGFHFQVVEGRAIKAIAEGRTDFYTYASPWISHYLLRKGAIGQGRAIPYNSVQDGFSAVWMNCEPRWSVLADVRLRQALGNLLPWEAYARERVVRPIQVAQSVWHPLSWAFDPTPKPLPKRELALQLLDQAGWRMGPNGWRVGPGGKELSLRLVLGVPLNQDPLVKAFVESITRAGIRVEVEVAPGPGTLKAQVEGRGDMWVSGWVNNGPDPSGDRLVYTTEGIQSRTNFTNYRNPEVDRLFEAGSREVDLEARKAIYHRINQILFRDRPLILLEYSPAYAVAQKDLKGVAFSHRGVHYGFYPGLRGWKLEPRSE